MIVRLTINDDDRLIMGGGGKGRGVSRANGTKAQLDGAPLRSLRMLTL